MVQKDTACNALRCSNGRLWLLDGGGTNPVPLITRLVALGLSQKPV